MTLGGVGMPSPLAQVGSMETPPVVVRKSVKVRLGGSPQDQVVSTETTPGVVRKTVKERLGTKLVAAPVQAPPTEVMETRVEEEEGRVDFDWD